MAARASIAAIITRTRSLIFDPAGGSAVFTDDQIQDALDAHRVERRYTPLQPQPTYVTGGAVQYLDFYSDVGGWEDDYVLQDVSYTPITASLNEPIVGHWHFTVQPNGMSVHATGKTYDLYGSAADLLDAWAASVKLDFGFQNKTDVYNRNQKFQMLTELADTYRALALPVMLRTIQSDAAPEFSGGGVVYPDLGPRA